MQGEEPLLSLRDAEHKLHAVKTKPKYLLRTGSCQMGVDYQEKMKEGLKNLGLYQMKDVHRCKIDIGLITALIERWRPETNSFHLPVGECIVTLEDVSYLWGLSVTGLPISGCTDDHYSQLILDCLGHEVYDGYEWDDDNEFYYRKVENLNKPNEKVTILKNYMRLSWLHQKFSFSNMNLGIVDDQEVINRHTRAFATDLFGSTMFPNSNSSSVSLMYLQFVEDLGPRGGNYYNWGGAVLACLYRELSRASRFKAASINGPLLLLQMWSWTRFSIGRPTPPDIVFGGNIMEERPAYGVLWTTPHKFDGNPVRGTLQFRDQFERLKDSVVNWMPYRDYQNLQPWVGIRDQVYFACRVWCIHFWEVEIHMPERVFRQFGLFQAIPPPAPISFSYLEGLRKWTRANGLYDDGLSADWREHFRQYIVMDPQALALLSENRQPIPYLPDRYHLYIEWFFNNDMHTMFPNQNNEEILSQPVSEQADVANLGYVADAVLQSRARFRLLNQTAKGISMVQTRGQKTFGLMLLENSRDVLSDLGHFALFKAMLERANLPSDLRNIDISDDHPNQFPIYPDVTIPESAMHDDPSDILESLQNITIDGCGLGDDGASASTVNPLRRKKKKPNKYSDSKFKVARGRERIDENEDEDLM